MVVSSYVTMNFMSMDIFITRIYPIGDGTIEVLLNGLRNLKRMHCTTSHYETLSPSVGLGWWC